MEARRRSPLYGRAAEMFSASLMRPAKASPQEQRAAFNLWDAEDAFARGRKLSGEKRLIVAVLELAVHDFLGLTREYPAWHAARAWIFDDGDWQEPFSFEAACDVLSAHPERMRQRVLAQREASGRGTLAVRRYG